MKKKLFLVAMIIAIGSITHAQAGLKRKDLQKHELGATLREVVQVHVEIEKTAQPLRHKHPGVELVYVLEGEIEYDIEGKGPVVLKAGDVLFIPYGVIHSARNVGKGKAVELATYIVEKGKPLLVLAK